MSGQLFERGLDIGQGLFECGKADFGLTQLPGASHHFERESRVGGGLGAKIRNRTFQAVRRVLQGFGATVGYGRTNLRNEFRTFGQEQLRDFTQQLLISPKTL